jgi:hypothetical protein
LHGGIARRPCRGGQTERQETSRRTETKKPTKFTTFRHKRLVFWPPSPDETRGRLYTQSVIISFGP